MMNYTIKQNVAVVRPDYPLSDGQDAAKLINAVRFQTGCTAILMDRSSFVPELFTLSSGVAEQVLKPFTQNKMRLAIVGDFYDCYQTSMRNFIFGCNRGDQVGFWVNEQEGLAWLPRKR